MAAAPQSPPAFNVPVRRRGITIAMAILLFFATVGGFSLYEAATQTGDLVPRILLLLMAGIGLGLPSWFGFVVVRRKLQTGHYLLTLEARRAHYAKTLARESSPTYRRLFKSIWVILSLFWLGMAAFWIRTVILHPHKLPWACFWLALSALNAYPVIHNIRKPPFLTRPS